jgi:hypothetical protein
MFSDRKRIGGHYFILSALSSRKLNAAEDF